MGLSVGVAVITHSAKQHLQYCLPKILDSSCHPRVVVVNSSSNDGTVEEAQRFGAETLIIPRKQFNHGSTRELARHYLDTDYVVMMTPDAYLENEQAIEALLAPIIKEKASLSYGRQLPHERAKVLEAFHRTFNYPSESHIRGFKDIKRWGVYSFFCSNSFAAYRNAALDEIGGFPSVLTAEDGFVAAALLRRGHQIAYVAEATVRHSHDYSLRQDFKRFFDTGYVRKQYQTLTAPFGKDVSKGHEYVKTLLKHLWKFQPSLLPYCCCSLASRYLGYHLGRLGPQLPTWLCTQFSSQDFFWSSEDFLEGRTAQAQLIIDGEKA